MKKKLLILPVIALFTGLAFALKPMDYVPVLAEGEETTSQPVEESSATSEEVVVYDEKTYIHEEDGIKATLVLISPTEFSMTVGEETKYGVYVRDNDAIILNLGGNELKISVNELLGTFGEYVEPVVPDEKESKFMDLFENFVVPAISALLGVVGFSGIVAVIIGVIKLASNKKANDERKKDMTNIYKNGEDSLKVVEKAEEEISKAAENIDDVNKNFKKTAKEVIESNNGIKDNVDMIPALIKSVVVLGEELAIYMSNNPDQVANGNAEKVNKVIEDLKHLK